MPYPHDRASRAHDSLSFVKSKRLATTSYLESASPLAATRAGAISSSASQTAIASPVAACAPTLMAYGAPRLAEASTIRRYGSLLLYFSTIATESSVDPLSETITSHGSDHDCLASASSCVAMVSASL